MLAEAGIGDDNVELVGLLPDRIVEAVEIGQLGRIATHAERPRAERRHGGVELGLAAAGDEDRCAFGGKALGDAKTDASSAARDDGNLAFEFSAHDLTGRLGQTGDFAQHADQFDLGANLGLGEDAAQLGARSDIMQNIGGKTVRLLASLALLAAAITEASAQTRIWYVYINQATRPATIGVADSSYTVSGWTRLAGPFYSDASAWVEGCRLHRAPQYNSPDIAAGRVHC